LLREIGRGGMGLVWLAERADGALKRQVALKLPRLVWGAGLAERMARERDIGALLEHPHIARLYDAGVDVHGRPYLAFEFIDGQAIDAWCKARALAVPARLRLFAQVARAVAYAHGRLVVHRDLKPSNVLVTPDGQAHLLDFGIAKLLDEAGDAGGLTQEQGRVLTPHYASPEQLRGEPITVASDVYSLGVLLFELLTGRMPYDAGKGLAAIERAVLEGEAPLASSRCSDAVARALRGDIDAILAKALQRDAVQRYATADALADDIERHLHGERVLAQPDRVLYRLAKALRRHRLAFAAAGAVAVTVLAGAAVSIVQAQRATEAAQRAQVVKDFVVDVFKVNDAGNPANAELRQLPVEVVLERGAALIDTKFTGNAKLQAELYGVVAGIFSDMGAAAQAEAYARKQLTALDAAGGGRDERAASLTLLSRALANQTQLVEGERTARAAIELATPGSEAEIAARLGLVSIMAWQSRDKDALAELDRIDDGLRTRAHELPLLTSRALYHRAFQRTFQGDFDAALPLFERSIELATQAEGPLSVAASSTRLLLARRFVHSGDFERAKRHMAAGLQALRRRGGIDEFRAAAEEAMITGEMAQRQADGRRGLSYLEAIATIERLDAALSAKPHTGIAAPMLARVRFNAGLIRLEWGDVARAHALIEPALATLRPVWSAADSLWGMQMSAFAWGALEMHRGEHQHADQLFAESIERRQRARRFALDAVFVQRARNLAMQGRFDEAEAALTAPVPLRAGGTGAEPPFDDAELALYRAGIKLDRGDAAAALALIPDSAAVSGADDYEGADLLRGAALCATGRARQGLPLLEAQIDALAREHYAHDPRLARWRALAGLCAWQLRNRARANELFELSRTAFVEQPGVSPYFKQPQVRLAAKLGKPAAAAR
jgi:serine/threonine-protein kinase